MLQVIRSTIGSLKNSQFRSVCATQQKCWLLIQYLFK